MSEVMRHNGAICIDDATGDSRFANGALARLGVTPKSVLCGAARLGGRYLGMIELANPVGDTPFHENEQSALEYLCAQFAELVANRPVVLDPEIVL
jgi:GAF domain-containing protein